MKTKEEWRRFLCEKAANLGFHDGFHLLYCPWDTIDAATVAFISLNPGRAHPDNRFLISDERGNSYEVEQHTTLSPITDQFLKMCDRIGMRPSNLLTGVAAPFRSDRWSNLSHAKKTEALAIGRQFWKEIFEYRNGSLRIFITVSEEASKLAICLTGATEEKRVPSGWGNTNLIRYCNRDGVYVVRLPHLSSYKLFSREECRQPLEEIFKGVL